MVKTSTFTAQALKQLVAKIEKAEAEKKETAEFISDSYKEAKSQGFDVKILRKLISIRKQDAQKVAEDAEILNLYLKTVGMTPLEQLIELKVVPGDDPREDLGYQKPEKKTGKYAN